MISEYILSWLANFLIISVIVGIVDSEMYNEIEKHLFLGAFLIFVLPTAIELCSYFFFHKPFLWLLA